MRLDRPVLICLLVFLAASVVGGQSPIFKDLNPGEAFALMQENKDDPNFLIVDVRTPEEYAEERLTGAVNLNFYADTFRESLSKLDRTGKYLVYCRSGARSRKAVESMKELGFREAYNLMGGINAWLAAGLPVVKN